MTKEDIFLYFSHRCLTERFRVLHLHQFLPVSFSLCYPELMSTCSHCSFTVWKALNFLFHDLVWSKIIASKALSYKLLRAEITFFYYNCFMLCTTACAANSQLTFSIVEPVYPLWRIYCFGHYFNETKVRVLCKGQEQKNLEDFYLEIKQMIGK